MKRVLSEIILKFDGLVNYFIPETIAADRDARNRAHVFLISHILGPFIGNVVPAALFVFDPHPNFAVVVLAISITSFWVFPFALRAGAPYNPLALVSIQNLIFCILWSCYFYGGVTSPTVAWVLTIPILAFFYLGSSTKLRLIVIAMFVVNLAIFCGFYVFSYSAKTELPVAAMQGLGLVSTIAASLYVTMMAVYYAKIQASQADLESEMRKHMIVASELRSATEEAERAGAAKAEFLARMSHELRTPLNAVIGYSQILLEEAEDEGDDTSTADLTKIHNAGQHLLKLVNEVLELSKIEAGKMELDLSEVRIDRLLGDLIYSVEPQAAEGGNRVICTISPDVGSQRCDASKLRNVIGQLLDNAIKFTENGKIDVTASLEPGEDGNILVIAIADTGIGIAPDQVDRLFETFIVGDDSSTSKYGGTGLGLALSQKLCKLMNGDILVESDVGRGSRFTVRIPVAAKADATGTFAAATLVPESATSDPFVGSAPETSHA